MQNVLLIVNEDISIRKSKFGNYVYYKTNKMKKPIVIYTDHIMNRTLCYSFAKGSDSLLCHVNNFKDYNSTIATYGVLRGTYEVIKKVKNFYYMDHGYFSQSIREFKNNNCKIWQD